MVVACAYGRGVLWPRPNSVGRLSWEGDLLRIIVSFDTVDLCERVTVEVPDGIVGLHRLGGKNSVLRVWKRGNPSPTGGGWGGGALGTSEWEGLLRAGVWVCGWGGMRAGGRLGGRAGGRADGWVCGRDGVRVLKAGGWHAFEQRALCK